jgi:hypothetical protein
MIMVQGFQDLVHRVMFVDVVVLFQIKCKPFKYHVGNNHCMFLNFIVFPPEFPPKSST